MIRTGAKSHSTASWQRTITELASAGPIEGDGSPRTQRRRLRDCFNRGLHPGLVCHKGPYTSAQICIKRAINQRRLWTVSR